MPRQKTIDREKLLDLAEDIVRGQGAAALTIDALARAAGVTKGGIQYTFASKGALIEALCDRWFQSYDTLFQTLVPPDPTPADVVRAHVGATFVEPDTSQAKAASLMANMLQSPEYMRSTRDWYTGLIGALDPDSPAGRRARLAFLATEGAFFLRYLGLRDMTEPEWAGIAEDIRGLLLADGPAAAPDMPSATPDGTRPNAPGDTPPAAAPGNTGPATSGDVPADTPDGTPPDTPPDRPNDRPAD